MFYEGNWGRGMQFAHDWSVAWLRSALVSCVIKSRLLSILLYNPDEIWCLACVWTLSEHLLMCWEGFQRGIVLGIGQNIDG